LDIYIKVNNVITVNFYNRWRLICIAMMLICSILFVGGCGGCNKSKRSIASDDKKPGNGTIFNVDLNDYTFVFPASSERHLKITSKKGKVEGEKGPYTLNDITVSVVEKGKEVATITAKNCKADITGNVGNAKITGDVVISAIDKTNKITILTEEVTWKSDSDKLIMKEFEIDLNEKGLLRAKNGEISTDLRSFKYDSPKLEIE